MVNENEQLTVKQLWTSEFLPAVESEIEAL